MNFLKKNMLGIILFLLYNLLLKSIVRTRTLKLYDRIYHNKRIFFKFIIKKYIQQASYFFFLH